jgi:hypothetical protein
MGWRRRAGGGKRDAAEKGIVYALEAVGARVWRIGGTGNPDLLCLFRGAYFVYEVKTGKGKKTVNQGDIPWPVITSPDEALKEIGAVG